MAKPRKHVLTLLAPLLVINGLGRYGVLPHTLTVALLASYSVMLSVKLLPIGSALVAPCLIVMTVRYSGVLDPFTGGLAAMVFMTCLIALETKPPYRAVVLIAAPMLPVYYMFDTPSATAILLGWLGCCFVWYVPRRRSY